MERRRILCVDDDINMLNSSEDILISAGFDVSLAKSGTQALKLLQKGVKCDLILLDVDMPDMDGFETIKEVQRIENCRDIPVIFVTGMDAPDFEIKGLELGASDYIVKPFIKDILIARINSQLRKKSAEESIVKKYKDDALAMMTKELSDTELMVAKYVADGLSNQEIAERTNYSYAYIKKVTSSILGKLDLQNRTEIRGMLRCDLD